MFAFIYHKLYIYIHIYIFYLKKCHSLNIFFATDLLIPSLDISHLVTFFVFWIQTLKLGNFFYSIYNLISIVHCHWCALFESYIQI